DQAYRIHTIGVQHVYAVQVARSKVEVLVDFGADDQHVVELELVQLGQQTLGLVVVQLEIVYDDEATLTDQFGNGALHGAAVHLLFDFLLVALATGRAGFRTTAPQGATGGSGTGTTRALLAERLASTAPHFGARLLLHGSLAATGQVGHHHLVNQDFVEGTTK